jgi:hypothetical protein
VAVVNPSDYALNASALDRLIASLKARVGQFLGNQATILAAQDRIKSIASSATGAPQTAAKVLVEKGNALLKIQADTEKAAQDLLSRAADLKAKPSTPLYSFLSDAQIWNWGSRQYELLASLIKDTVSMISEASNMASRVASQNSAVGSYVSEVQQTEQAATGTGIVPRISAVIQGTVGTTAEGLSKALWPVAIAAVAGLGLYAAVSTGSFKKVLG